MSSTDYNMNLFSAITKVNNEKEVCALIEAGADINKTVRLGETPLFYAVKQSNNEIVVRALIDAGADVNVTNYFGETTLFHAAKQSDESVVCALIDAGADVNVKSVSCQTALLYAVQQSNNKNVVRALIDAGADANKTNHYGKTALFYAVQQSNNESVVRTLIDAGADVTLVDKNGKSVLFYAFQQTNNDNVILALIDAGADVNEAYHHGKTALFCAIRQSYESVVRALIDAGADVNKTNDDGATALLHAVQQSNESVVRVLIDAGADVNKLYRYGKTALFYAVQKGSNKKIACALIDAGADVNKIYDDGKTALLSAFQEENNVLIHTLIQAGADVNKIDRFGQNALFYAVRQSNTESVVRALIAAGADVNVTRSHGVTALIDAVRQSKNERVVRVLIDAGADVNITRSDGVTALFTAVKQSKNESVVRVLIDAGAYVNITGSDGTTALFDAVRQSNNESVVRALIDGGADVNITNNDDQTALFNAVQQSNNESVVCALIEAGTFINAKDVYGRTAMFYAYYCPKSAHILLDKGESQYLEVKDNCNCSILTYFVEKYVLCWSEEHFYPSACHPGSFDLLFEHGIKKASIVQTIINTVMSKFPLTIPAPGGYRRRHGIPSILGPFTTVEVVDALEVAGSYMDDSYFNQKIENLIAILENEIKNPEKISEALRLLIELGADPNSVDSHGNTALHYATRLAWMGVPQETVMEICHQMEKLGVQFNLRNHQNQTPLLFSLSRNLSKAKGGPLLVIKTLVDVCEFLLKHGSSIKERSLNGNSVFHLILKLFHQALALTDKIIRQNVIQETIRLLQLFPAEKVARSRIINISDNHLNTPLHLWASLASPQGYPISTEDQTEHVLQVVFKYLLRSGAQLNARNSDDETPLHLCNTWSAVKLLISEGANLNDVDSLGRLPLLAAAKRMRTFKIPASFYPDIPQSEDPKTFWQTAIEKGLDPWTADKEGESVLSILVECESFVLASALVDVACEKNYTQSELFTVCLLNAICKDKSTRTSWKSNLVQDILKSRKAPTNEVSECEAVISYGEDDENLNDELSLPIKKVEIDQSLIEAGFMKRPVHFEIMNILRSHGADGESCLDLTEKCPQLQDLLTKPLDNDAVPVLIPWTSVSKRYVKNLAKVARRQKCDVVHDVFWHYKDHIAGGSFGSVFVGINENDGREVAIKRIEKLRMQRPEDKREITNLTALADCEQVVRYLHFFEDEKFAYIILELMEGNLDEYLGSAFDAEKSTQLCEDVVKGLKYLHEQDIIHRDLKPGNILYKIHPKCCLKIADFGLSLCINSTTTTVYGTNAGTRCWIAPEVLMSTSKHSLASDIFSCGLVLHYILSVKKHPFSKNNSQVAHEIESNITNGKTEGWDHSLCPEATHLVKDMLSSQDSRPTAQQALDHPLFWSNTKKIDLLIAVGNQPVFEYPRTGKTTCLTVVEADLEKNFSTIVVHGRWNDHRYKSMPAIYTEMTSLKRKSYDTHSVVELVRFIRNAYAHVSEDKRPTRIKDMLLKDFVFLEYFPSLVTEVYKVVITHGWHQTKEEIKYAMNK